MRSASRKAHQLLAVYRRYLDPCSRLLLVGDPLEQEPLRPGLAPVPEAS